ncbi:MAG TPA: carboxypeptidase-like regulatory domain-containing protein [Terriglobales bacterium]|nr:carboxypeptidase-like regulatory domain-containing protein [Terriglobales bacterium]
MKPHAKAVLMLGVLFLATSLVARAQNTAEVQGTIVDPHGHPVVSAFVIITSQNTALMRAATTNDGGEFKFSALPVGRYKVEVKADGFGNWQLDELRANIGQVVTLDIKLSAMGAHSELHIAPSMIETSNTQLGVVTDSLAVSQLPLKSRDPYELLQLQPGVEDTLGTNLFFGSNEPGVVSVNGARARSNNFNVNGGNADDLFINAPSLEPSPDSIGEFRVISHDYDADLGRNSGSVVNVVTKSGSDSFHGSAYEFVRNNVLNAEGYLNPQKSDFKQNQFGGSFGGPIRRGKTFFFSSYEGLRLRDGISSGQVVVPTMAERSGNFSAGTPFAGMVTNATVANQLNQRRGCSDAVADAGGAPIAAGTAYAKIFRNNIIPQACFDPTALDLLNSFVPFPNVGSDLFRAAPDEAERQDQLTTRLDHNLTSAQQLSLYYFFNDGYDNLPYSAFQAVGANLPDFGNLTRSRFQQLNVSHNWMLSARTTNEARFVYYREGEGKFLAPSRTGLVQDSCTSVPAADCFSDPANPRLGITPGYSSEFEGVPFVNLAGGFSLGNNANGFFSQAGNVYQAFDSVAKTYGKHTVKFGIDARDQRFHQTYYYNVNGNFMYTGGGPNDVGYADLVPNYLLGLPDIYSQGSANGLDVRSLELGLFAGDAWKIRSNATFYYGLRWELNTPQADAGRRVQEFRAGQATRVFPCQLSPSDPLVATFGSTDCSPTGAARSVFPLGLVYPGDPGVPEGLTATYMHAFAPRLGFAWSPNATTGVWAKLFGGPGKSSVRAGWGIYYDTDEELMYASFAAQPPYGGSTYISNPLFNTPFLTQGGVVTPNPFNGFQTPSPGSPIDFARFRPIVLFGNFPPTLRPQYAEQYHLTIQRELTKDTMLQFGYVGSEGHRLIASVDQNYGTAQTCLDLNKIPGQSCGSFGEDDSYYIPARAIPAGVTLHLPYGSVPTVTGPNPNPITLVGLRKYSSPFCQPTTGIGCPPDGVPVFSSLFAMAPIANSVYNSFQAELNRRFSHGLELLASYTWSKSIDNASSFENSIDPLNPEKERSLSLFHAEQRFVVSEYWRIPTMPLSNWTRYLVNGWALAGIWTLQSGFPIRITSSNDSELMGSFDFETPGEPSMIAPFQRLNPQKSGGYYFNPASFTNGPLGVIGSAPRDVCCGPGIAELDLALHKDIPLVEGKTLEFRTEFFNVFNRTQFLNPDGNFSDGASFGTVSGERDPRIVQLALRLIF